MKKRTIIPIIFVIMLLSVSFVHAADNQFQDIIDLVEDVFGLVIGIFTLPILTSPKGSFGLFLFMFWLMLFSILNFGARAVFTGGNQRVITIVSVSLSTMVIILLNFQSELLIAVIGNWLIWIWLFFVMAGVILPPYLAHRFLASRDTAWGYLLTALICFASLMLAINNKNSFEGFMDFLDTFTAQGGYFYSFIMVNLLKKYLKVKYGK